MRFTSSRLSPWISMRPSFTVPPTLQAFCIFLASSFFSGRPIPGKLLTTVTALPPRCAVWRMMSTRPRFVFFFPRLEVFSGAPAGVADDSTFEESSGPAGNPSSPSSAPNGFCVRLSPPPVDMRCFFRLIFASSFGGKFWRGHPKKGDQTLQLWPITLRNTAE